VRAAESIDPPGMPRTSLSRLIAPALVALSIVIESSGPALALAPPATDGSSAASAAASTAANAGTTETFSSTSVAAGASGVERPSIAKSIAAEWAAASKQRATAVKVKPVRKTAAVHLAATFYRGRNHVWIPSLGVSRAVTFFSCSDSGVGNHVYRWGCAGHNNVYLFGHASSVFKPLHDAYTHHRLRRGMKVVYADAAGHVRTYRVTFWKVVSPTGGAWAYAAQSRPSLTLQTCVGADSAYRLIVRLVAS
jgi:sortase (surface protein transpeptidase)